jgi:hypothetical protein
MTILLYYLNCFILLALEHGALVAVAVAAAVVAAVASVVQQPWVSLQLGLPRLPSWVQVWCMG